MAANQTQTDGVNKKAITQESNSSDTLLKRVDSHEESIKKL